MTNTQHETREPAGPEGSVFLFSPLSEREFKGEYFAMMLSRGPYREMEADERDDHLRELKLRRALTERAAVAIASEI